MSENDQNSSCDSYLAKEKISKLLLRFSLPSVLSMLVSALYNIVDQIFIGQGVGYLGNTATNIVYPFTVLALALALLLGDGASSLMSLAFGKQQKEEANKAAGNCIVLSFVISLLLMGLGFAFEEKILWFFGATENCFEYAKDYFDVILIGIPFYMVTSSLSGVIRADGSPRYSMLATVLGCVINVILDPIAILYMKMGTRGAAITTVMGQFASFVMTLIYFFSTKTLSLKKKDFVLEGKMDMNIAKLGISSFIIQMAIVIVISVANKMINIYGPSSKYGADIPLAVIGIVMKVFGIVIAFGVGVAVGGQPLIGYNYGAKNYLRVRQTLYWIMGLNIAIGLCATVAFEFFPQAIINIFGAEESELYNEYAVMCFRIYLGGIVFTCIQKAGAIFLQSLGKPVEAILLSLSRDVIFFVPALIILSYYGGVVGMLYAALIGDVLSFFCTLALIQREMKKMRKEEKEDLGSLVKQTVGSLSK
jgi:putative MATE family efflux protein